MRRVRYQVASSLDGFLAGPNGEYEWIPGDPDIDMEALWNQFDVLLMGRKTFEKAVENGGEVFDGTKQVYVVSTTLAVDQHPDVNVIGDDWQEQVAEIRSHPGKDIWLFGGGQLFRSLLSARLVDSIELAVVPVMLGDGVPVLPGPYTIEKLKLENHTVYPRSGIVLLEYSTADAGACTTHSD